MKIPLDKYYTPLDIAKDCIGVVKELCPGVSEWLEPSAGNGSFSLQLENCIALDIEPEHPSIIKQDFIQYQTGYKPGRCVIGNPPFGERNNLTKTFFNKAVELGDYIAFVLPVSQYNNTQSLYKFDLIYSVILPRRSYSGVELICCFNIYKRPAKGAHKKPKDHRLKDVTVVTRSRGDVSERIDYNSFDYSMCGWGCSVGKKPKFIGEYAEELYIKVNNPLYKEDILDICRRTDWTEISPTMSGSYKLQAWRVYKHLSDTLLYLK
jgi:hypothetical protein